MVLFTITVIEKSSFFTIKSPYFLALAIFDSMVLLNVILLKGLPNMVENSSLYVNIFTTAHPMMNLSWTMSIYLTLFLTLERYFALCWSTGSVMANWVF